MNSRPTCFVLLLALATAIDVSAAEPIAPPVVRPELEPDRDLLARIAELPDDSWLKLPPPRITGDMGVLGKDPDYRRLGPRVRSYCNRLVWAPERRRALYCGGGHNVHPWNDVWEFDLAANTWVCLYGADPAPPRTVPGREAEADAWYEAHAVVQDGTVRTPRGGPLRPCHTWWGFCYDTDRRRMLFVESHKGLFFTDKAALARAHGLDPADPLLMTYGSGAGEAWLFAFSPESGAWQEVFTGLPKAGESSCLEYLPDQKRLWWNSGKTYLSDDAAKPWQPLATKGPGLGGVTAYDPESRTIVAVVGRQTWVFSCETNAWTLAQTEAPVGGRVPESTFCWDSAAKRFVLVTHFQQPDTAKTGPRLWLYDRPNNTWTPSAAQGDRPTITNLAGYYDPARNVTVVYSNRETWVYRAKRTGK